MRCNLFLRKALRWSRGLLPVFLWLLPFYLYAQFPEKTDCFVNDFAHLFAPDDALRLEQRLQLFSDTTTNQIVVVTIEDLQGYAAADYAQRLGDMWGVGHDKYNNGVLILLKPKNENGRGQVFIATGYGAEGVLTDLRCGQIIDSCMMEHLQRQAYFHAVEAAVDAIEPLLSGEYNEEWQQPELPAPSPWLLLLLSGGIALGVYVLTHPSKKSRMLHSISNAESVQARDVAVDEARQIGIKQSDIDSAVAQILPTMRHKMLCSTSVSQFETLAASALQLGASTEEIDGLRARMSDETLQKVRNCRDRYSLNELADTARNFGNSPEKVAAAVTIALAAIAAAELLTRNASRRASRDYNMGHSTGSTWHSGFGGGRFGGGGAGRSF